MSNADKTLVQVATYNEMESLPRLVKGIFTHAPDVDLLIIDDNSPDGTGDWARELSKTDSRIHTLHRTGKLGLGTAIVTGIQYAIASGYKQVVNMDADSSHDPKDLPAMIGGMERNGKPAVDVMIGSRYIPRGRIVGWPLKRHVMSRGINIYSRLLLNLAPHDCSGGYRCYRCSLMAQVDFDQIQSWGYSFQEEILWHLQRLGGRFGETPITFVDREAGQSKINNSETFSALWIILKLGWRQFTRS